MNQNGFCHIYVNVFLISACDSALLIVGTLSTQGWGGPLELQQQSFVQELNFELALRT